FAGTGHVGHSGDGGPATDARLWTVDDLARRPDGGVVIADLADSRLRLVGRRGTSRTLAGMTPTPPAVGARAEADNSVLVANSGAAVIERVAPDGERSAAFTLPTDLRPEGIAAVPDGSVFVSAFGEPPRLLKRAPDGTLTTLVLAFSGTNLALG